MITLTGVVIEQNESRYWRLNVGDVVEYNDTIRIETIDRVRCRINNQEWDQDEKTNNLFIELTGTESELIKSKFSNYGYGIIYVKNNQISNVEVLFDA